MNTRRMQRFLLLCIVVVISWPSSQSTGQYQVNWHTINSGGGISRGGPYALIGTAGQPHAGAMVGGDLVVLGGFWPGTQRAPLCIVEFDDFAQFAELWLLGGPAGDLDDSGDIDFGDLQLLADYWLSHCPYGWPLQ